MTRVDLLYHTVKLKILSESEKTIKEIEIKNGYYQKKQYSTIILSEDSVIIEGSTGAAVLSVNTKLVDIKIRSAVEIVAEKLNDSSVYIDRSDAVPEGMGRAMLRLIMEPEPRAESRQ